MCKYNQIQLIQTLKFQMHSDLKMQMSLNAEIVSIVQSHG